MFHNGVNGSKQANQDRQLDKINILAVSHDLDEVMEINRELKQANVGFCLHVVGDAAEAMAYLLKEQPYAGAPKPDLVLLFANMPAHGRIEFFNALANHPGLIDMNAVKFPGPGLAEGIVVNGAAVADGRQQESRAHSWLMRKIATAKGAS